MRILPKTDLIVQNANCLRLCLFRKVIELVDTSQNRNAVASGPHRFKNVALWAKPTLPRSDPFPSANRFTYFSSEAEFPRERCSNLAQLKQEFGRQRA